MSGQLFAIQDTLNLVQQLLFYICKARMIRLPLVIFTTILLAFAGNILAGSNHPDDEKMLQKIELMLDGEKDIQA